MVAAPWLKLESSMYLFSSEETSRAPALSNLAISSIVNGVLSGGTESEEQPEVVEPDPPDVVNEVDAGPEIAVVDAAAPPPTECGDLDYLGECDGSVARWCSDEGRLRTRDCGGEGCGWVDDELGYFCGGYGDRPGGGGPEGDPPPVGGDACGTEIEAAVAALANEARQREGRGALQCDAAGTLAARAHSQDMCDQDYFSHTGRDGSSAGDRLRRAGARFGGWGENIAWGQDDAQEVHRTWMNSPGHRSNILGGGYGRIGVGFAVCGGRHYWTQVFMD